MLLISDFAGDRQTIGAAIGQGWAVLGAVIVAGYTQCFGAAYKSLPWFMAMLSAFSAVSIGAACYVAKEIPVKRTKERQSCCQNVTSSLGKILSAVRSLPNVLVVYCVVTFFIQFAYAAYNGNKGMFFGLEVFDGDATNAATCDTECSEAQRYYSRGVQVAGGVADILFCVVGYLYSWLLPPLVRCYGVQLIMTLATILQVLLMAMAFCNVVAIDVAIAALTAVTSGTFFALIVPLIIHVNGHTTDIGVYVGLLTAVNSAGQLLNSIVGSAIVETAMGFRLPVFVGGVVSLLAFFCIFFRIKMNAM
ncbi:hypothetical protein V7S43_005115 [Phytophthora oleae]|uniref:Major facilitator superfamily (MFS) profile domain-containing protein n=1 Tax=Phytophthora oleae TaxID=2107226 RepID=A0ABD3FS26_9STRA